MKCGLLGENFSFSWLQKDFWIDRSNRGDAGRTGAVSVDHEERRVLPLPPGAPVCIRRHGLSSAHPCCCRGSVWNSDRRLPRLRTSGRLYHTEPGGCLAVGGLTSNVWWWGFPPTFACIRTCASRSQYMIDAPWNFMLNLLLLLQYDSVKVEEDGGWRISISILGYFAISFTSSVHRRSRTQFLCTHFLKLSTRYAALATAASTRANMKKPKIDTDR